MVGGADTKEESLLVEALSIVKAQALEMKLNLDKGQLMEALKHASVMLGELRTSLLSPKNYYELYIVISDQLKHLELYLLEEYSKGRAEVPDLYELVQYFGNIIPRLYLLITVGLIYMKTYKKLKQGLLLDMVEMCRGVQHPLRGLFLRNYLLQCVRTILPNGGNADDRSDGATVRDSIDFILLNFAEMNKLWVRMQHQGHSREKEKREKEREELRLLVGTNLVRLSQLDSITVDKYCRLVLPGILEQVVSCRDVIAQEYLMECIIQVFPDDFHLATLNPFLKSCAELQAEVNVKQIVTILVERLTVYYNRQDTQRGDQEELLSQLFDIFSNHVVSIIHCRDMKVEDSVSLQVSLVNLALGCYHGNLSYVDGVLLSTFKIFEKRNITRVCVTDSVYRELVHLLCVPIDSYNNVLTVARLEHLTPLLGLLDLTGRRTVAVALLNNALNNNTLVTTPQEAEVIFGMIRSLICSDDEDEAIADDPDDFAEQQSLLARWVHLLQSQVLDQQYLMLSCAKKALRSGSSASLRHTYPALAFSAYSLALRYSEVRHQDDLWERKCVKIVEFCLDTVGALQRADYADLALRLYLHGALAVGRIRFANCEDTAYEFLTQAFTIYEDRLSEVAGDTQCSTLCLLMATFETLDCFGEENAEPVRAQCYRAAGHLDEPHNCGALMTCAHLFWSSRTGRADTQVRNAKRVTDCLEKVLKTVQNMGLGQGELLKVQVLVQVLNRFAYFYEQGNDLITIEKLNKLIKSIRSKLGKLKPNEDSDEVSRHFESTLEQFRSRAAASEMSLYQGVSL